LGIGNSTGSATGAVGSVALTTGSSNTLLGHQANVDNAAALNRIALGYNALATADYQCALADNITHLKTVGLTSAADGAGTLLAIDSSGLIKKAGGTNNTVTAIDTFIASKNQPGGLAPLDGSSLVPVVNLPKATTTSDGVLTGYTDSSGTNVKVALGYQAGNVSAVTNGIVAIGFKAGQSITGNRHVIIGQNAGGTTLSTSADNTIIGDNAGGTMSNRGQMVIIGSAAGKSTNGTGATIIGNSAGQNANTSAVVYGNTAAQTATGLQLTAVGYQTLKATSGTNNTALGYTAGLAVTTGASNTLLGNASGSLITTGSRNTLVGDSVAAGTSDLSTGSDNTIIGYSANTGSATASGRIVIGSGAVASSDNQLALPDTVTSIKAAGLLNTANGLAQLNASAQLPLAQLPAAVELNTNRNQPSGYPALDSATMLNGAQQGRAYSGLMTLVWTGDSGHTFTYSSDVTYSANTTLSSDVVARTVTVNSGVTLNTAGYSIWCEKLVHNGTIADNGSNGTNGSASTSTGGAGAPVGTLGGGMSGGSGTSPAGSAGTTFFKGTFFAPSATNGGNGASGSGGSSSTGGGNLDNSFYCWQRAPGSLKLRDDLGGYIWAGAGGGSGAGDGTNFGGAGGGGAGVILIYAKQITGTGVIRAVGGNGGNATAGNCGGGGGGGGGMIILHTLMDPATFTFTASVAGGTGGTGSGTGTAGAAGSGGRIAVFSPWTAAMP
jgi:hypothetical protein